jgi:hypothetical protein
MGCLRNIGCLTVLAVAGAAAFYTRDLWWDRVREHHWNLPSHWHIPGIAGIPGVPGTPGSRGRGGRTAGSEPPASDSSAWEPLTAAGAARTKARIEALGSRGGPAFVVVPGGDFASYIILDRGAPIAHPPDSTRAAVIDDALHLRTVVDLRAIDRKALGPMANFLGDVEPVELVGTLDMARPGMAELQVTGLSVRGLPLPAPIIPRLMLALEQNHHQAGAADNGVLIPLPPAVGDVRAAHGRITLYKSTP